MSVGITKEGQGFDTREFVVKYGFIVVTVSLFLWFAITEPSFRMQSTLFSMLKFTSVVLENVLTMWVTTKPGPVD